MDIPTGKLDFAIKYWSSIPTLKIVDDTIIEKIVNQNFRKEIVDILSEGLQIDKYNFEEKQKTRHVLSVKEIMRELEKRLHMSIKYPGLYFHINKLEENKIIQEVLKVKEKKNNVTYYGLTARNFSSNISVLDNVKFSEIQGNLDSSYKDSELNKIVIKLHKYLSKHNSEITKEILLNSLIELEKLEKLQPANYEAWIESNQEIKSAPQDVLLYLKQLHSLSKTSIKSISRLHNLLDIE